MSLPVDRGPMHGVLGLLAAGGPVLGLAFLGGPTLIAGVAVAAVVMFAASWMGLEDERDESLRSALVHMAWGVGAPMGIVALFVAGAALSGRGPGLLDFVAPWAAITAILTATIVAGALVGERQRRADRSAALDPDLCPRCGQRQDRNWHGPCPECGLTRIEAAERRESLLTGDEGRHVRAYPGAGLLCVVLGLAGLSWGAVKASQQLATLRYDETRAVTAEIYAAPWSERIAVRYDYEVGGATYSSRRVSYADPWITIGSGVRVRYVLPCAARRHAERFNASGPVVYYDPAEPSRAVLVRGVDAPLVWWTLWSLALLAFGLDGVASLVLGRSIAEWAPGLRAGRQAAHVCAAAAGAAGVLVWTAYEVVGVPVGVWGMAAALGAGLLAAGIWRLRDRVQGLGARRPR